MTGSSELCMKAVALMAVTRLRVRLHELTWNFLKWLYIIINFNNRNGSKV